jgi:hypothetical protein
MDTGDVSTHLFRGTPKFQKSFPSTTSNLVRNRIFHLFFLYELLQQQKQVDITS